MRDHPPITLIAAAAMGPYLRVKISGGQAALAGATDEDLGTLTDRVLTAGDACAVWPKNAEGSVMMVSAGAFAAFADIYGAADGKVDDTANENFIGTSLEAAGGADEHVKILRGVRAADLRALGAIDGPIVVDDDFIGDYPAAATALATTQPWLKVETNGLGVTESDEANGVLKFAADAVAEAATAALYMPSVPFKLSAGVIFECRLAVFDIGDDAALDINFGLASGTHATDFDAIANYAAFHLDGSDLSVKVQTDDGTTADNDNDTGVDLTDDTYATFRIDASDPSDVKFYINGTRVLPATTFDLSGVTGRVTPIFHVEKTSNDTTFDVRADRVRVQGERA